MFESILTQIAGIPVESLIAITTAGTITNVGLTALILNRLFCHETRISRVEGENNERAE